MCLSGPTIKEINTYLHTHSKALYTEERFLIVPKQGCFSISKELPINNFFHA